MGINAWWGNGSFSRFLSENQKIRKWYKQQNAKGNRKVQKNNIILNDQVVTSGAAVISLDAVTNVYRVSGKKCKKVANKKLFCYCM